jgi:hypothetical protein
MIRSKEDIETKIEELNELSSLKGMSEYEYLEVSAQISALNWVMGYQDNIG